VTDNKEASAGACVETERGEQQSIVQEVVVAEDEEEPGEDEVLLEGKGDELIADDGEEPIDEKLEELIEEDREELIEGEEITIDADGNEDSMEEYADDLASSDPFGWYFHGDEVLYLASGKASRRRLLIWSLATVSLFCQPGDIDASHCYLLLVSIVTRR